MAEGLRQGVEEQALLLENQWIQRDYIPKQPAFVSRERAKSDDVEWLVVVRWERARARSARP